MTPADFLNALFTDIRDHETVVLGTPWGRGFAASRHPGGDPAATHFSIGLQTPTSDGPEGRQTSRKANVTRLALLVLDDVMDKVPPPRIPPTYRLLTRRDPPSEHWGYAFREPLEDLRRADALVKGVTQGGLSDPGMSGLTRWARLPDSDPKNRGYGAALVSFEPGLRFDPAELPALLGFRLGAGRTPADLDPGEALDDPIAAWLTAQGLVDGDGGGWLRIECPWGHEHSDGRPWAHYRPASTTQNGSFCCHHGHGGNPRTTRMFLDWIRRLGGPGIPEVEAARRRHGMDAFVASLEADK